MDGEQSSDDVVIDPAWAESFALELDPEQTLRAAVDSATAETLPVDEAAETQRDDPTAAETLSMAPSADTARAATIVQADPASAGGSGTGSVPTRRLGERGPTSGDDDHDYHLQGELGAGGMGVVYAARQASLGRTVALKRQRPDRGGDPALAERFVAEAMVTGLLEHPNIVPVYELGADATGGPFYSMKLVQGSGWDQIIDRKTLDENLETWQRVADGIAFAHSKGLIHCDLKPANVMLGAHGEVLVVDWGLAMRREAGARFASPIAPGATVGGTPAYMPPELARLDRMAIGPCTDIYLLGALLFRLATGRPPHAGDSLQSCMRNAAANLIAAVAVPPEREDVLTIARRAMATEPAARFADVQAMQEELRGAARRRQGRQLLIRADELAIAGADHLDFDRALEACREASVLLGDEREVASLTSDIRCRYAQAVMAQQDNVLAMSLLDMSWPEERRQREAASAAHERQQRRRRQLRQVGGIATALGLIVAVVLWRGLVAIDVARARAAAARQEAEVALREADHGAAMAALARASVAQRLHDRPAARTALDAVPPHLRGLEWRLLDLLTQGERRVLALPGSRPSALCWSGDGTRIHLADADGSLREIDAASLEVRRSFASGLYEPHSCRVSPDGTRLLLADAQRIQVLDLADGDPLQTLGRAQRDCRWFDDHRFVLVHEAGLDLSRLDGRVERSWVFAETVDSLAVADGRILAGVGVRVLALDPDGATEPFAGTEVGYSIAAVASDGRFLAQRLEEWSLALRAVRDGGTSSIEERFDRSVPLRTAQPMAEGFAFSFPEHQAVYLFEDAAGGALRQLIFTRPVRAMTVHPDGRRLACATADSLQVVTLPATGPLVLRPTRRAECAIAFESDGLLTYDKRGAIHRRDAASGVVVEELLAAGRKWLGPSDHMELHLLPGGAGQLLNTGRSLLHRSADGDVRELLPKGGKLSTSLSPAGDHLAICDDDGRFSIISLPDGREQLRLLIRSLGSNTPELAWSSDGRYVVALTHDSELVCIRADDGHCLWTRTVPSPGDHLEALPGGGLLATFGETIHLIDWQDGRDLQVLHGHQAIIIALAVDPEHGRMISGDEEGWLLFWDMQRWEQTIGIRMSGRAIIDLDLDGAHLVFSAWDQILRCWDFSAGAVDGT